MKLDKIKGLQTLVPEKITTSACVILLCTSIASQVQAQTEDRGNTVSAQACTQIGTGILEHKGDIHVGSCINYTSLNYDEFEASLYPWSFDLGAHFIVMEEDDYQLTLGTDAYLFMVNTSAGTSVISHAGGISANLAIEDFGIGGSIFYSFANKSLTEGSFYVSYSNDVALGVLAVTPHLPEIVEASIGHSHEDHNHNHNPELMGAVAVSPNNWLQINLAASDEAIFAGATFSLHLPLNENHDHSGHDQIESTHDNHSDCDHSTHEDHSEHDHDHHSHERHSEDEDDPHQNHSGHNHEHPIQFHFHPIF